MNKILGTLLLLTLCPVLFAGETTSHVEAIVGGWSYHNDRSTNHNETHNNLGVRVGDYSLVYYKNSKHRDAVVFAKDVYRYQFTDNLDFGVLLGAATGYTQAGDLMVAPLLRMSYQYKNIGIDLHGLPGVVTQLQFKYIVTNNWTHWVPDNESKWAVGYAVGYPASQVDISYKLNDYLNLRAFARNKKFDWHDTWDWEGKYGDDTIHLWQHEKLHVQSSGIVLDYFPWNNHIGLYVGIADNNVHYDTIYRAYQGQGWGYMNIDDSKVKVNHGDKLYGHVNFDRLALTYGVRWGNPFITKGWSLYVDLGVIQTTGLKGEATFMSEYMSEEELDTVQDKVNTWVNETEYNKYKDKLKYIPNVSVGLQYRF